MSSNPVTSNKKAKKQRNSRRPSLFRTAFYVISILLVGINILALRQVLVLSSSSASESDGSVLDHDVIATAVAAPIISEESNHNVRSSNDININKEVLHSSATTTSIIPNAQKESNANIPITTNTTATSNDTSIKTIHTQNTTNKPSYAYYEYPPPTAAFTNRKNDTTNTSTTSTTTNNTNPKIILKPTIGNHRPQVDSIFAFAEGYELTTYVGLIEPLLQTGFNGDLVLSVSSLQTLPLDVKHYLEYRASYDSSNSSNSITHDDEKGFNLVVYTVTWTCFDGEGEIVQGTKGGIRRCQLVGMYGHEKEEVDPNNNNSDRNIREYNTTTTSTTTTTTTALPDPREPRPVATARYELYWLWSLQYNPHSWIMLIDARDTHFQLNPFQDVEREKDLTREDGLLYFFGENFKASNIYQSNFNRRWLEGAYGKDNVSSYMDKTILCSGSTMGEQVALESYLRAMVVQFDNTSCKMKGCDQGFHNYLYYSSSLVQSPYLLPSSNPTDHASPNNQANTKYNKVKGIRKIKVFDQGEGIINNLGLLRSKPLREWGVLNVTTMQVLEWDKSISPVAHQIDRDQELSRFIQKKKREVANLWRRHGKLSIS